MQPRERHRSLDPTKVVLVDESGDISHYETPEAAAGHMEAIDVENGEYTAVYGLDGTVFELWLDNGQPRLRRGEHREPEALQQALRSYFREPPGSTVVYDPYALVNMWQLRAWQRRWPRRPSWLAARVHGSGPVLLAEPHT